MFFNGTLNFRPCYNALAKNIETFPKEAMRSLNLTTPYRRQSLMIYSKSHISAFLDRYRASFEPQRKKRCFYLMICRPVT